MPRVAAVQIEASHLDPEAGSRRIEEWATKAAAEGAEVIVFPELLIPGYPRCVPDPFPASEERSRAWQEGIAVADLDLGLVDEARLVWNQLGDEMRDDPFRDFVAGAANE